MTNIKITDKAGVTLKTAGKYCSEDIGVTIDESLLVGGELTPPTAVPISGMVDKVYFNFNVDISKIAEIIVNLPYIEIPDFGTLYPIISNADMTDGLLILKNSDIDYYITRGVELYAKLTIASTEPEYELRLYDNKDTSGFYKNDFTQPIEFGFENMVGVLGSQLSGYVNSNELLKEMISITPIQKIESGNSIVGYKGTQIPNDETIVEKLYVNTKLSIEETVSLLDKLTYIQVDSENDGYFAFWYDAEDSIMIGVSKNNGKYIIGIDKNGVQTPLFIQDSGWQEFENPIEINHGTDDKMLETPVGRENEKISSILSITPFEVVSTEEFIDECSNAVLEAKGEDTGWKGTPVPNSGTIEKVYFNTDLSVEEVNSLLSQLTYKSDATDTWYHVVINGVPYILIYKVNDEGYIIINSKAGTIIYNNGWHSFANPQVFNVENQTTFTENDKLSSLFSITPFTKNSIYPTLIPNEIRKLGESGSGIIEVDDLPEEGKENCLYVLKKANNSMHIVNSEFDLNGSSLLISVFVTYVEEVDSLPTDNIVTSQITDSGSNAYVYKVKGENELKLYSNIGDGNNWYSVSQLLSFNGMQNMSYQGKLLDTTTTENLKDGYYLMAYKEYYIYANNSWECLNPAVTLDPSPYVSERDKSVSLNTQSRFGLENNSIAVSIYVDNIHYGTTLTQINSSQNFTGTLSDVASGQHNIKVIVLFDDKRFKNKWFEQNVTFE